MVRKSLHVKDFYWVLCYWWWRIIALELAVLIWCTYVGFSSTNVRNPVVFSDKIRMFGSTYPFAYRWDTRYVWFSVCHVLSFLVRVDHVAFTHVSVEVLIVTAIGALAETVQRGFDVSGNRNWKIVVQKWWAALTVFWRLKAPQMFLMSTGFKRSCIVNSRLYRVNFLLRLIRYALLAISVLK